KESALSKYPLIWMIDEAMECGLTVNPQTVNQLAWGAPRKGSPFSYVVPDIRGELHDSMTAAWRLLEYVPKKDRYKEWPDRESHFVFYTPEGERRLIREGVFIHESGEKGRGAGRG